MTIDTFSTGGRPAGDGRSADALDVGGTSRATACCVRHVGRAGRAPLLPADTAIKRRVDRFLPRWGWPAVAYFAVVAGLFGLAQNLPAPAYLAVDAAAFAAGGIWCALNFWRCRQAHCLLTGSGWLLLALFAAAEAGVGRSLISGDEQLVFLAILAIGLGFEAFWYLMHRTNAVTNGPAGQPRSAAGGKGSSRAVRRGGKGSSRQARLPDLAQLVRIDRSSRRSRSHLIQR